MENVLKHVCNIIYHVMWDMYISHTCVILSTFSKNVESWLIFFLNLDLFVILRLLKLEHISNLLTIWQNRARRYGQKYYQKYFLPYCTTYFFNDIYVPLMEGTYFPHVCYSLENKCKHNSTKLPFNPLGAIFFGKMFDFDIKISKSCGLKGLWDRDLL